MKEKTTMKVVCVDDEIEVVVSERSSIDSNLEDSTSNHEDVMYPLVIAGTHNDVFMNGKDEKDDDVAFKAHGFTTNIKTEDTKPLTNPKPYIEMSNNPNCYMNDMCVKQQDLNFQSVKPQVKQEENYASPPKRFAHDASAEGSSCQTYDKDPIPVSSTSKLILKDPCVRDNSRAFLWHGSSGSEKIYPTYFLESDGRLWSNIFDKAKGVAHTKEEKTVPLDVKPALHETGASTFGHDCRPSAHLGFKESSKDFIIEKSDIPCKLPATTKQHIPSNVDTANSEAQVFEDTRVHAKGDIKAVDCPLDKSAVLQAPKCRKRELDLLYDNLKEISWAQDKSFTNLLGDKEIDKRLERISSSKGCSLTSRRTPIGISIWKKIIKKVSAQQRNYPPRSKEVKQIEKKIRSDHSQFLKDKLGEKQKIKWYSDIFRKRNFHPSLFKALKSSVLKENKPLVLYSSSGRKISKKKFGDDVHTPAVPVYFR